MSKISKNNYEAYLLDEAEGNLSPLLTEELRVFLNQHPHLKEELPNFDAFKLNPPKDAPFDKSALLKNPDAITLKNCEDIMIAEIEGENAATTSAALKIFIKENPAIEATFLAYQQTKLIGSDLVFEHKKTLYKKTGKVIFINWKISSAAAVILVLLTINWFSTPEPTYSPLAEKTDIDTTIEMLDDDIFRNTIIRTEKKLALKNKIIPQKTKPQRRNKVPVKIDSATTQKPPKENNKTPHTYAQTESKAIKKDTIGFENNFEDETMEDENLMAANSVTIIYEDEPSIHQPSEPDQQKTTKLDLARVLIKHQFKKIFNKGKEKVLFAANSNPFILLTKDRKSKEAVTN